VKYKEEGNENNYEFSGFNMGAGLLLNMKGLSNPIPLKFGVLTRFPYTLKQDNVNTDYEHEIDMPFMIGFGASYRIGEFFTLAADYEMRKYSDSDNFENDLNEFRLGVEYILESDLGVFPLRAGFKTVPTIETDVEVSIVNDAFRYTEKDQVIGSSFSIGTGFISGRFSLDVAYTYSSWKSKWEGNYTIIEEARDYFTFSQGTSTIIFGGIIYF